MVKVLATWLEGLVMDRDIPLVDFVVLTSKEQSAKDFALYPPPPTPPFKSRKRA